MTEISAKSESKEEIKITRSMTADDFFRMEKEYDLKCADENITEIKKMIDQSSKEYKHMEHCRRIDNSKDNPFDNVRELLKNIPIEKLASELRCLKSRIKSSYYRDYLLGTQDFREDVRQIFSDLSEANDKVNENKIN